MLYDTKSCRWMNCNLDNWVSATPNRVFPQFKSLFLNNLFFEVRHEIALSANGEMDRLICQIEWMPGDSIGPWHEIMGPQREVPHQIVQEFYGLLVAVPTAFLYDTKSNDEASISELRVESRTIFQTMTWNHGWLESAWQEIVHDTKSCIHSLSTGWEISCKISNRAWSEIVPDMKSCMTVIVYEKNRARDQIWHDSKSCVTWNPHLCDYKSNRTSNRMTWNHAWL